MLATQSIPIRGTQRLLWGVLKAVESSRQHRRGFLPTCLMNGSERIRKRSHHRFLPFFYFGAAIGRSSILPALSPVVLSNLNSLLSPEPALSRSYPQGLRQLSCCSTRSISLVGTSTALLWPCALHDWDNPQPGSLGNTSASSGLCRRERSWFYPLVVGPAEHRASFCTISQRRAQHPHLLQLPGSPQCLSRGRTKKSGFPGARGSTHGHQIGHRLPGRAALPLLRDKSYFNNW